MQKMLRQSLIKCHLILSLHLHGVILLTWRQYRCGIAAVKISRVASVLSVEFGEERKSGVKARLSWLAVRQWEGEVTFRRIVQNGRCLLASIRENRDNFE